MEISRVQEPRNRVRRELGQTDKLERVKCKCSPSDGPLAVIGRVVDAGHQQGVVLKEAETRRENVRKRASRKGGK